MDPQLQLKTVKLGQGFSNADDPLEELEHSEPDDSLHAYERRPHMEVGELDDCRLEQRPLVRELTNELSEEADSPFFKAYSPPEVWRAHWAHHHPVEQRIERRPVALKAAQLVLVL